MPVAIDNSLDFVATIENFRTIARKTKQDILPPSIGNVAENLRFNEELGSIEKRKSRAKYAGMSTLGTSRVTFMDRYYKNTADTRTLIIAYDTTLKKGDDSDGSFTNIKTGLTADKRYSSLTYKDIWYVTNDTDGAFAYDGTNFEDMGVPTPGSAPSVATGAAGALTGDYKYKVTFELDGYQEGNASSASATVSPASEKVDLSSIPTSSNGRCTARNIYRTQAGGSVYYFLTRIADNSTTTYTDNTVDGSLDTTLTAPSDNAGPGTYQFMTLHKSRIFLAKDSTVVYSKISSGTSQPDVFPAANIFYILRDNGEDITGILEDNFGQLIIFKPSAVIRINTNTDDPVGWSGFDEILSEHSAISPYAILKTNIGIVYLSLYAENKKRLMLWDGQKSSPIFEELEPLFSSIVNTTLNDIVAEYYDGSIYFAYADPDAGNTFHDRLLIVDLISQSWVIDKKNVDSFSKWTSGSSTNQDSGELYTGTSDATGFVYREDTSFTDVITKFKSEIQLGTVGSNLTLGGTEQSPTLTLNSGVDDDVGASVVSTVSDTVSDLTADAESVSPSGTYISPVLEVNAKVFSRAFWNVAHGSYGFSAIYVRAGATEAACAAAAWSDPYFTPSESDISGETANRYVQYKVKLFIDGDNVANASDLVLSRGAAPDDYVVKITFGFGTIAETSFEMVYESSWDDFGWLDPRLRRVRKRLIQARIDYERSEASGTLDFGYYIDNSNIITEYSLNFSDDASQGYSIYRFPLGTYFKTLKYRLFHDDDVEPLKITAIHFLMAPEPLNLLI